MNYRYLYEKYKIKYINLKGGNLKNIPISNNDDELSKLQNLRHETLLKKQKDLDGWDTNEVKHEELQQHQLSIHQKSMDDWKERLILEKKHLDEWKEHLISERKHLDEWKERLISERKHIDEWKERLIVEHKHLDEWEENLVKKHLLEKMEKK